MLNNALQELKMKQDEIRIKRLLQKCEDWLSNKIQNGTGTNKWWRLDQVRTGFHKPAELVGLLYKVVSFQPITVYCYTE